MLELKKKDHHAAHDVPGGGQNNAADGHAGFDEKCSEAAALRRSDACVADGVGVGASRPRAAVQAAVDVRAGHYVDVCGLPRAARTVELVRRDLNHGSAVPVVRVIHDDALRAFRVRTRQADRNIVRLRAGVDEEYLAAALR